MDELDVDGVHTYIKEHFSEEIADKFKGRCELIHAAFVS